MQRSRVTPAPAPPPPPLAKEYARANWILAALFLQMAIQGALGANVLSATFDEPVDLGAGYSYLRTRDFRLNREHPPLAKELAALPLLAQRPDPLQSDPGWTSTPPEQWGYGSRFTFQRGNDSLLVWGRLPMVGLGLLMLFFVWRWARDRWGSRAGLLAAALCSLSPTVLGHARLVTSDAPLACFSVGATYFLWRYTKLRRPADLAAAGLTLGAALSTKFSAVVLLPTFAVLLALDALVTPKDDRPWRRALYSAGGLLVLAALVVQASYLFTDPLAWFRGIRLLAGVHATDYAYYLRGDFRPEGWWYYPLVAFAVKTPLPMSCLLVAGTALLLLRTSRATLVDDAFVLIPAAAFTVATCLYADNLGVRYLLPAFPFLFVLCGRVATLLTSSWKRATVGALLGWYAITGITSYPDELSYFNEAAGGPAKGHLWLDDSNIDWGQDLGRLAVYMKEKNIQRVNLKYGGVAPPDAYGVAWDPVSDADWAGTPRPGYYAIGTNQLIRGRYFERVMGVPTDWIARYTPEKRIGYSIWIFHFE